MLVRDLLKTIAEDFKLDDEVYISDNYGCCAEINYIDKTEVYSRDFPIKSRKCMTINIKQRIDFRKPEDMLESEEL